MCMHNDNKLLLILIFPHMNIFHIPVKDSYYHVFNILLSVHFGGEANHNKVLQLPKKMNFFIYFTFCLLCLYSLQLTLGSFLGLLGLCLEENRKQLVYSSSQPLSPPLTPTRSLSTPSVIIFSHVFPLHAHLQPNGEYFGQKERYRTSLQRSPRCFALALSQIWVFNLKKRWTLYTAL